MRREHRRALLERTAFRQESAESGVTELAAMQWIERVSYHTWRAMHHLGGPPNGTGTPAEVTFESIEGATPRPAATPGG
jgi:hypothetical protein